MAYSLLAFQEETGIREAVVPTKWIRSKVVFWSNGFNAVRDLKQRVGINDHWPSYPLMKIKLSDGKI